VQRLFSAFPEGWPGAGLVLLRVLAAAPLLQFVEAASIHTQSLSVALQLLAAVCSGFVIIGLWTPVSAALLAVAELCLLFFPANDSFMHVVMAVLCASLAMTGPGAWSVDARLFGRKRIRIPRR
jgi:putative oxidoreductase